MSDQRDQRAAEPRPGATELSQLSDELTPPAPLQKVEADLRAASRQVELEAGDGTKRTDEVAHSAKEQARLGKIQRNATLAFAQGMKIPTEDAMAQAQADFMTERNRKKGVSQEEHDKATSQYQSQKCTLTPQDVADWTARCERAADKVVALCASKHPELQLTRDLIKVEVVQGEESGAFAWCYPGDPHLYVSRYFAIMAEKNPEWVVSVVAHELHGHPEYGPEYGGELYTKARSKMTGQPVSAELSSAEYGNYAYPETEIFAQSRQLPYEVPIPESERFFYPVATTLEIEVKAMREQWEPRVGAALLHGLYKRMKATPEITSEAIALFAKIVSKVYADRPDWAKLILSV